MLLPAAATTMMPFCAHRQSVTVLELQVQPELCGQVPGRVTAVSVCLAGQLLAIKLE